MCVARVKSVSLVVNEPSCVELVLPRPQSNGQWNFGRWRSMSMSKVSKLGRTPIAEAEQFGVARFRCQGSDPTAGGSRSVCPAGDKADQGRHEKDRRHTTAEAEKSKQGLDVSIVAKTPSPKISHAQQHLVQRFSFPQPRNRRNVRSDPRSHAQRKKRDLPPSSSHPVQNQTLKATPKPPPCPATTRKRPPPSPSQPKLTPPPTQ